MSVRPLDQEALGIFELDDDYKVIYSSLDDSNNWVGAEKDINGLGFFTEVLGFTNAADLQRRLEAFKAEAISASSFDFVCHFQHQSVPVKVLLARLYDQPGGKSGSVLIHLRRNSRAGVVATASSRPF
jgi:hypothetical protein